MSDYERIARFIRFLDQRGGAQPSLEEMAALAGLSPSHFHRLFVRWAGTTPKDFLQILTFNHAARLLREGHNVLDAALASGLSGPGRLHDVCVSLVAATPGEIKTRGEGLTIVSGRADTPFGEAMIAQTPRGICHLAFLETGKDGADRLRHDWPLARITRDDGSAREVADRIFCEGGKGPLRLWVRGTAFQVRVWKALLEIPEAQTTTYGRLAASLGKPTASRAVGAAVGANRVAYLIPCHRVIRETGALGGYHWGPERKIAMLARERLCARRRASRRNALTTM